jgi:hypothetical protein
LWVDLRWARTESSSHSALPLSGAVLDVASTLLKRPKESLDSEEVRVYKRKLLAAYAAVIVSPRGRFWSSRGCCKCLEIVGQFVLTL